MALSRVAAILVAAWLLLPGGAHAQTNIWIPGAVITNPITNQVLVTTAALPRANWRVTVYVYSDAGVSIILQRLNSASTVLTSVVIPASASYIMWSSPTPILTQDTETFRVIARAGATAEVQAVLLLQPQ